MAVFKCKMCGANLVISENQSVVTCEYCNTQQTLPKIDDEKKLALFNRANNLRLKSEFDKAAGIYESIVAEFSDEAEAYWGLVLCKYGIEYVDDKDGKKIPTCHRTLPTSIMKDTDFEQACENADISAKAVYRGEAKAIDAIQKKILEIAGTEEPYDIFICYKETDDVTGARTEDSSIAQDIYTALTEMGYKVFYARNSLRRVAGAEYEPYIYAALSSAKVMLAIGTKYEYYDAVWVKNEWSRFISMMADNTSKVLIPCYKNMDAYDIPEEFSNMQALDMSAITFFGSLEASVKRVLPKVKEVVKETVVATNGPSVDIEALLKRAFLFIGDGDWKNANVYCEKVLDVDPENAQAYLGKLMIELKVNSKDKLKDVASSFETKANYQKISKFGSEGLVAELKGYIEHINNRNEEIKKQQEEKQLVAKEKRNKRNKKIALVFSTISVLLTVVILCECVIIPRVKFTDIIEFASNGNDVIGVKSDGTVVAVGSNSFGECDVSNWTDIIAVSVGSYHTVGLKSDGTVVVVGDNDYGQHDAERWTDIVEVSSICNNIIGLKSDGTVVAVGDNDDGQCNVSDWTDIVAISAGCYTTVGLKSDGTVVAVGDNEYGQCGVEGWTDIVAIEAGFNYTLGVKSDGTVVAVGDNGYGQCNVRNWTDIVAVSSGGSNTIGLKSDGTVVAVGYNYNGQCDVEALTDIVSVCALSFNTVGLKSDGTIAVVGEPFLSPYPPFIPIYF